MKNIETHLIEKGMKLMKQAATPFSSEYRPELDVSPELDTDDSVYYQSLIGIVRWIVEMGRFDI